MTQIRLTLDQASKIIAAAFDKAREMKLKPICAVVLDAGGYPIAVQRQDGATMLRSRIATGKAFGAIALGVSSRTIGTMAVERPTFVGTLSHVAAQAIVPAAGGVLIAGGDGAVIGAVGVSGDTSDNDEAVALAGIAAAGLTALS